MTLPPLKFENFMGEIPVVSERNLPDNAATLAVNLDLVSGELRPTRKPTLAHSPSVSGPWITSYRAEHNGMERWRQWNKDVDVVQVPFSQDVEQQYCWSGDGEPRYAPFSLFGYVEYALGVPAPKIAPTVTHSGGVGSATTRFYRYTFNTLDNKESAPSPVSDQLTGKVDGTWEITSMQAVPINSGNFTGTFASGKTTCNTPGPHWLRTGDEVVIDSETYVATVVDSDTFTVAADVSTFTLWERKAHWNTAGMTRRLYRTTGTTGSWQLVAEGITSTNFTDTLTDAQILGDDLVSSGWEPPRPGLKSLCVLPSGALVGVAGRLLCFSEPYQPHAWPRKYELGTAYDTVGCAPYGTVVCVATAGTPYTADGVDPLSATLQKSDHVWPCLSKRSVCSIGDGTVYATTQGLAYIGVSGSRIMTESEISPDQWQALNPHTMVVSAGYGKLIVSYLPDGATERKALLFMPSLQRGMLRLDLPHDEIYLDPRNGRIYFTDREGVKLYDDADGVRTDYVWTSKEVVPPAPGNYGAVRVDFEGEMTEAEFNQLLDEYAAAVAANQALVDAYDGSGSYGGASYGEYAVADSNIGVVFKPDVGAVTFSLYSKGKMVFAKTLITPSSFKLPAGFKSDIFKISLRGNVRVRSVKMAETMSGLKSV